MENNLNDLESCSVKERDDNLLSPEDVVKRKLGLYDRYIERCDESKNNLSLESAKSQSQIAAIVIGFLTLGIKDLNETSIFTLKALWFAALVFLIISLFLGIKNISTKWIFYRDMTAKLLNVLRIWHYCSKRKYDIETAESLSGDVVARGSYESSSSPGGAQKVLFFVGVSVFFVYIFVRLFVFKV